MAEPNWEAYAQAYGGRNQGQEQLGRAVGSAIGKGFQAIPNVMDRLAQSQGEGLDNAFAPLLGLVRRKGILNPIAYKQQYDAQMEMYLPVIKQKIEAYKTLGNKSEKSMRKFLSSKQGLNEFLLQNTSPEEQALSPYLKPERTWEQWAEEKGGALGLGAKIGGAGLIAGIGATGASGAVGATNLYKRMGSETGLSKKDMKALDRAAKGSGYGKSLVKQSEAKRTKKISSAKSVLTKAQNKYKKASKNYKGKKFANTKQAKSIKSTINSAKANIAAAKSSPVKTVRNVLDKAIKKHGKSKVIRMMAKKVGVKGAVGLLAKTGLAAIPGGQFIGGALVLNDIRMVYNILSDLAE